jgi:hypothetical protein
MADGEQKDPTGGITGGDQPEPQVPSPDAETRNPYKVVEVPEIPFPYEVPIAPATDAGSQIPAAGPSIDVALLVKKLIEALRKFAANPTRLYAAIGVGLGILVGAIIAAISWHISNVNGPYDLGYVTSNAAGLKGHLFTKWDKHLEYRLEFEPGDPGRQAAFAFAVANPPHPLFFDIQLKDGQGFVLCSREIVVKYDARKAAALAAAAQESEAGKTDSASVAGTQPAQGIDFARLDAEERERERDKDIFQNEIGADGKMEAINAQGQVPCSKRAYENTTYWSFTSNFPSIYVQDAMLKHPDEIPADEENPVPQRTYVHKKKAPKIVEKPFVFYIEGDDAVVEYDVSRGIVETSGGKVFFMDKAGSSNDPRWEDYPVTIHYKCDQSSDCTLTHAGIGALRVRLRR